MAFKLDLGHLLNSCMSSLQLSLASGQEIFWHISPVKYKFNKQQKTLYTGTSANMRVVLIFSYSSQ